MACHASGQSSKHIAGAKLKQSLTAKTLPSGPLRGIRVLEFAGLAPGP